MQYLDEDYLVKSSMMGRGEKKTSGAEGIGEATAFLLFATHMHANCILGWRLPGMVKHTQDTS